MKAFTGVLILIFTFCCQFVEAQQQTRTSNLSPNLFGSISQAETAGSAVRLSIADAINRALKYNLGGIIGEQETRVSTAARVRALSELLPRVGVGITENVQQINLAAYGFRGFPGVGSVVGPFTVFDARARYSQSLLDFKLLHELRAASERVSASNYALQDVRELIVLITTDLYLEAVAGYSRVEAARAQLRTAQAVYDRTRNLKDSGVVAGIDVLRAQVQLQAQQQRVLAAENELAKQKLDIARAIGFPQGQNFVQTDAFVTEPANVPALDQALSTALEFRADYRRAASLVHAAEETRKAAIGRRLPSLAFNSDYGAIGRTPTHSHGTMLVEGMLTIPLYTGERVRAEILESDALLEQRKAEAADLRDRIEYEIRTADLDIQSAADQVRVAQAARELAQQQLAQAQDRFTAGVANGLEVTQAQEAVVTADENYISSLYSLNVSEAALARATGSAEKTIKSFFGGK
jgi:outer membrane protein TolC